jgi:hypothetical protein
MRRKSFAAHAIVSVFLLLSTDTSQVTAANMRSFIEAVRRKATVVYVGSVREVHLLARTKFDIKARAVVGVLAVMRSPGTNPREATIEYSSFDNKTPMLEGGPQYQLRPGVKVVVFANSFASSIPLGYLLQVAARSCCTVSKPYAMLLATCLPTNSGCMKSTRKIAVFSLPCTKSFARTFVRPNKGSRYDA